MDIYVLDLMGSNCTFMELKLLVKVTRLIPIFCSNCTFMELKYINLKHTNMKYTVLIVPLWN